MFAGVENMLLFSSATLLFWMETYSSSENFSRALSTRDVVFVESIPKLSSFQVRWSTRLRSRLATLMLATENLRSLSSTDSGSQVQDEFLMTTSSRCSCCNLTKTLPSRSLVSCNERKTYTTELDKYFFLPSMG